MTRIRNKDRELRVSPLVKVVLFVLCIESQSSCCTAAPCYDYFTREARPCFPQPVNAARGRNVTASNTCGKPSTSYCEISPEKKCFICNASNALNMHLAEYMVCDSIRRNFNTEHILFHFDLHYQLLVYEKKLKSFLHANFGNSG